MVTLSGDVNEKDLDIDLPDSAESPMARPNENTRDVMQTVLQFTSVKYEEFTMIDMKRHESSFAVQVQFAINNKLILRGSMGDAD